jgi:hypothetical protein
MNVELLDIASRVTEAYGRDGLRVIDHALCIEKGIDPLDADFLSTVGVPREEQLEISFNLITELPTLDVLLERTMTQPPKAGRQVVCLNEKYHVVIGIDQNAGGKVIRIDPKEATDDFFINSRVRFLIGFFAEFVLHWIRWTRQGVSEEESFQTALQWMQKTDPAAFNGDTYWALAIEEMKEGLL